MSPAVTVRIEDALGNLITTDTRNVSLAIGTNPGGGTLTGGGPIAAVGGVATFSGLSINLTGNGYTLVASSSPVLTGETSTAFNITAGAASRLTFGVQPSNTVAGATITPPVTVRIEDANGNLVTTDTRGVNLAIGSNPGGGSLSGGGPVSAVGGIATFSSLSINRTGNGYTLVASSAPPLTGATSAAFNIVPAAAARLVITTQPSAAATAGVVFATQPVVQVQDNNGNLVSTDNGRTVTAARLTGTGTLQGITTASTVNGVATFTNLSYNIAETITIRFTATGLTPDTSNSVVVGPATAAQLTIATQPSPSATAGVAFATQPVIRVEDTFGNLITAYSTPVTAARSGGAGTLQGTLSVTPSGGIATFTNLFHTVANTITIGFTSGTLTGATSNNVVVSPAAASRLTISTQPPATATAGTPFSPQPAVRIEDAFGNLRTTDNTTVVTANQLGGTGTLGGTTTATASAGVATYTNLSYNLAQTITIRFSSGALTPDTSTAVAVSAGALNNFLVESSAGGAIPAQIAGTSFNIRITARDANLNTVTTFNGQAVITSTGTLSLGGGNTLPFTNGVLASHQVAISNTGNFTITATRFGGTEAGTSNVFTVNPGALNNFLVEAAGGGAIPAQTAGTPFSIRITARDLNNNTVTSFTGAGSTVVLTSPTGGLQGDPLTSGQFTNGVLASQGVTLTIAGANRTIVATRSGGSETGTSNAFLLNPGAATQVRVETQLDGQGTLLGKQNVSSGTSITVYSIRRDALGNFINNASASWSLQIISGGVLQSDLNPGQGGPNSPSSTFTGRLVGKAKIVATISGLTSVTSDTLTVVVAGNPAVIQVETAANGTGVVLPDTTIASGSGITVYAISRDLAGNFVRNSNAVWTIQSETGGVIRTDLTPGEGFPARSARFVGHLAGTAVIRADSGGLGPIPSGVVTVVPGTPRTVTATGGTPQSAPVNTAYASRLEATVRDSSGNPVSNVQVTFRAPTTGASGTFGAGANPALTDSLGTARSPVFTANSVAGTYRDTARVSGIAAPALFVLTNTAGAPSSIIADTGSTPQSTQVTTLFAKRLIARVRDVNGNAVIGAAVTFNAPTSGPTASFEGFETVNTDSNGIATSPPVRANDQSGSYTVTATVAGVTTPASYSLRNLPGSVAGVVANSGTPQTTQVLTQFPLRLGAKVTDLIGNAVPNVLVTFSAPTSGASATFVRGILDTARVDTARTDTGGIALSSVVKANRTAGAYQVTATVPSGGSAAAFYLTNTAGVLSKFWVEGGGGGPIGQQVVGATVATLISARDSNNNLVPTFAGTVNITSTGPLSEGGGTTGQFGNGVYLAGLVFTRAGNYTVTATRTGGAETGTSNQFAIVNPIPTVTGVTPPGGRRGQTLDVAVNGTGFLAGVTSVSFGLRVTVNSVTVNASTQLFANIRIDTNAVEGPRDVTVFNAPPGGGSATGTGLFTIGNNPVPSVTGLSDTTGNRLQVLNLHVRGANFIQGVTSLNMGPGIVTNTIVVDSSGGLTANISILATAPTGPHDVVVINAGPGGGRDTLPGAFSVRNPAPTLTTLSVSGGNRLEHLAITFGGFDYIAGATSVSFGDTSIVVDSLKITGPADLIAYITIRATAFTGQHTVSAINAPPGGGTSSLANAFLVSNPLPTITSIAPDSGGRFQTLNIVMRGTGYISGVSTVQIGGLAINSTTVDSATRITVNVTIGGAAPLGPANAVVINPAPGGGSSPSAVFTVTASAYPATFTIRDTIAFPTLPSQKDYQPKDYRIIGLPGASTTLIGAYIPGSYGEDWRMFWDNGAPTPNYYEEYDGGANFQASAGRGFWLIKRGAWMFNTTVPSIPLDTSGAVSIPLHANWNLITNPYPIPVQWSLVRAANVGFNQPIHQWTGDTSFVQPAVMEPYLGYYVFNQSPPVRTSLRIPFSAAVSTPKAAPVAAQQGSWLVGVELRAQGYIDRSLSLGVAPGALRGEDALDYRKPRAIGSIPMAFFSRPEWDPVFHVFAADFRPVINDVESWGFDVVMKHGERATLTFAGVEAVPQELNVYLIDEGRARSFDLRSNAEYVFSPPTDTSRFTVVIGTPAAVRERLDAVLPKEFALGYNFPNPFNPSTTLPVSVPRLAQVSLIIYNVLGEEVATLYDGALEGGRYWFTWDGRGTHGAPVATGMYLVRLRTDAGPSFTRKMLLLK
ncbi:MAG: FlgD immunoglobulin-like domain containing protein [Bacteroidota bacterium]